MTSCPLVVKRRIRRSDGSIVDPIVFRSVGIGHMVDRLEKERFAREAALYTFQYHSVQATLRAMSQEKGE